ncbi:PHD finger protein 21A-like isoform X1 [Schistocerca americana]|uniref:PHD finger protein 21A-like isoform X1 n=1 Tax=Schistocerca americana TaxID=7009 RepID=UPI001F4F5C2F|nr:PHD finger protein 21A-like isoform X1 [Schistocerca americana]
MEVSKAFQADIRHIQNQLKIAILNHQVMVKKKNEDPTNIHIQVQLRDAQRHIISLGEIQKQLIQRLRKELEANSTNSTLNNKSTVKCAEKDNDIEIIQTNNSSSSSAGGIVSTVNTKSSITTVSKDANKTQNGIIYISAVDGSGNGSSDEVRLSAASSPSSSPSSSSSDDEREIQESLAAEISQEKIAFLQAVGLITREILSDLQNRRVERKRRSTANHTQFVYGSHWDVSKRKKNGYLLSTSPQIKTKRKPQVHQKQQHQKDKHQVLFAENDRIVMPVTSALEKMTPVSSSVSQSSVTRHTASDKTNASVYQITPKEISRSLLRTSGTNLPKTSLRLASLPASLTIERVNSPPHVCIICGSTGMLSSCKNCSAYFHPSCSKEASCCPKCNTDQGSSYIEAKKGSNEPPNGLIIQQTTVPLQASFSERRALKERLAHVNSRLKSEKNLMEKRAAELTISLEAQASQKKVILQSEEVIRNKIQVINNFISVIKTTRSVAAKDKS